MPRPTERLAIYAAVLLAQIVLVFGALYWAG